MYISKITATPTRSEPMLRAYIEYTEKQKGIERKYPPFEDPSEEIVAEFKHFFIVRNNFPYDAIATTHDMIISRRHVALDWGLLNKGEVREIEGLKLKDGYISKNYDVFLENLPSGQTIPGRFHLHLLKLKRYEL